MNGKNLESLVALARDDLHRREFRRAKDRLRTVLRTQPHYEPALELMGHIYFHHKDYRNAVMYWSRAGYWRGPMRHACERVFKLIKKSLMQENLHAARYLLYAFAGCTPPEDLAVRLKDIQSAYFKLDKKKTKLSGLACAPMSGGCLLAVLGILSALLGEGLGWFISFGAVAVATTIIVLAINSFSYYRASKSFRESVLSLHIFID